MKKESNNLGFMLQDGRGGPCLISGEDSKRIATVEGSHYSYKEARPMPIEKRKAAEEKVISSLPEEDRDRVREILRKNHEELDQPEATCDQTNSFKKRRGISDVHSFEIVNGKLTGYHGMNEKIILVPDGVSIIGESAFARENSESIKTIILPETIVCIEKYAFSGCVNLLYINFPKSLRKIGLRPFMDLECLKHLYIPDEVMECDHLGIGLRLETLRLPMHLFNKSDCISQIKLHTLIIGLPEEEGCTPSQDQIDLHKIMGTHSSPNILLEQYMSSHLSRDSHFSNQIFTVDGCMLFYDLNGRDYIPDEESEFGFTYLVSIPPKNLCDSK